MAFEPNRRVRCYHARSMEVPRLAPEPIICGALEMKVLFATTSLPHLQTTGGEIASQAFIDAIRKAGHNVEVFGFVRTAAPVPAGSIAVATRAIETRIAGISRYAWLARALVRNRPYACQKFVSTQYLRQLRRQSSHRKADILVLDHARMGWLLPYARDLALSVVLIAHNHEAKLFADQARGQGRALHRQAFKRESRLFHELEARLAREVDQVWTLSAAEQAAFRDMAGSSRKIARMDLPGLIFAPFPAPAEAEFDIGLLGTWDWSVNGQGLDWFIQKIVPKLPTHLRIGIAGRGSERINGLHPNLRGLGYVDDPAAFLRQSRVLAIPSTVGAGIQLKTINAISAAMPTVSTTIGVRGITDLPRYVQISDSPEQFAQKLLDQMDAPRPSADAGQQWARNRQLRFGTQVAEQLAIMAAPIADARQVAADFAR